MDFRALPPQRRQGIGRSHPCSCRKLDPNVLMMQSAKNWNASDDLNGSWDWRIFAQRQMRACAVVIVNV
jgi:hypothetical protein